MDKKFLAQGAATCAAIALLAAATPASAESTLGGNHTIRQDCTYVIDVTGMFHPTTFCNGAVPTNEELAIIIERTRDDEPDEPPLVPPEVGHDDVPTGTVPPPTTPPTTPPPTQGDGPIIN